MLLHTHCFTHIATHIATHIYYTQAERGVILKSTLVPRHPNVLTFDFFFLGASHGLGKGDFNYGTAAAPQCGEVPWDGALARGGGQGGGGLSDFHRTGSERVTAAVDQRPRCTLIDR